MRINTIRLIMGKMILCVAVITSVLFGVSNKNPFTLGAYIMYLIILTYAVMGSYLILTKADGYEEYEK